jgi:peptide/nickel transport system substrate-binding protein
LDEAGWVDSNGDGIRDKNGIKMKVIYQTTDNAIRQQIQKMVQGTLKSIGVDVELKVVDAGSFFSDDPATTPNDYHQFLADMQEFFDGNTTPDPRAYLQYWLCDQIPTKANGWTGENVERWCKPEYDALYKQAFGEVNPEKRQQLFIQMNDMLVNDIMSIPLVRRAEVSGISRTIVGVDLTPWDASTWNIKDWRR